MASPSAASPDNTPVATCPESSNHPHPPSSSRAETEQEPRRSIEMSNLEQHADGATDAAPRDLSSTNDTAAPVRKENSTAESTLQSPQPMPSSPGKTAEEGNRATALAASETKNTSATAPLPAADPPSPEVEAAAPGPVCEITIMTVNGGRFSLKLHERYLRKRNVSVADMDPFNINVYTLKELLWKDWKEEEWEQRPTSPSAIRLIHFGRMLEDKTPLKECRFHVEAPNVIHMTVKPQDIVDEEDGKASGKGGIGGSQSGGRASPGCRCVIL